MVVDGDSDADMRKGDAGREEEAEGGGRATLRVILCLTGLHNNYDTTSQL